VLSSPELWSQEWHDSFVRNELVDFVPPLSSHLNCLLVGENGMPYLKSLPSTGIDDDERHDRDKSHCHAETPLVATSSYPDDEATTLTRLLDGILAQNRHDDTDYDCILDRGLMDELLASHADRDVGLLLLEATRHIREHGVYIVVTQQEFDEEMKEYLVNVGALLGMQWKFDLDGISDEDVSVSVARKYFTGELPTVGKLATVKRPMP